MPTYEYECGKCGIRFERFQSMTEEPLKKCPECGGKAKRIISAGSGVIFKGKGFYQTDYKPAAAPAEGTGSEGCGGGEACVDCPARGKDRPPLKP